MTPEPWLRWFLQHRGRVVGAALGLAVALAVMAWGILWTIFIGACVTAGYVVGRFADGDQEGLGEWVERLLPPGRR